MRVLPFLLILAACAPSSSDEAKPASPTDTSAPAPATGAPVADSTVAVELRTDKTQYRAGDRLTLTLSNRTSSTYAFNPCTRIVESESGSTWAAVQEEARMCTMEAWMLEPNQTRTADTDLPTTLRPGQHRVVIELTREGAPAGSTATTDRVRATSPAIGIVP